LRHLNSIERLFCFPTANGKLTVPRSQLAAVFRLKGFDWLSFHVVRKVLISNVDKSSTVRPMPRLASSDRVHPDSVQQHRRSSTGAPPAAAGSQPVRAHSGHAE
jgi:hypothetical protein